MAAPGGIPRRGDLLIASAGDRKLASLGLRNISMNAMLAGVMCELNGYQNKWCASVNLAVAGAFRPGVTDRISLRQRLIVAVGLPTNQAAPRRGARRHPHGSRAFSGAHDSL